MSEAHAPPARQDGATIYEIRIRGHLDKEWAEWFEGLTLTHTDDGHTILTGPLAGQPALHGVLNRIRNLNLALVSVNRVESNPEHRS
jgi:hypothetical protein